MDKDTLNIAKSSRKASHVLSSIPKSHKSSLLHHIHAVLRSQKSTILAANSQDLALAKQQVQSGKLSESLVKRLELNDEKFETLLQGVLDVEKLPDPTSTYSHFGYVTATPQIAKMSCNKLTNVFLHYQQIK